MILDLALAAWMWVFLAGCIAYMTWALAEDTVMALWKAWQPRYFKPSTTQPTRDLRDRV